MELESLTVDLSLLQPEAVSGRTTCKRFGFRIDVRARFKNVEGQAPSCQYSQEAQTKFTKKKRGIPFETKDTGLHDDGYSVADGVWEGSTFWVNDIPSVEVGVGESLEYSFYHRQTIKHPVTGSLLKQTDGHTVSLRGTYPDIQMSPGPSRVYSWSA